MTYEDVVAYVGDLDTWRLMSKLRGDGYDHPYPLAEALGIDPYGGVYEVCFRMVSQVRGHMCEFCGVSPLEHVTQLDEVAVSLCDDCFAEMMCVEDYG